MMKELVLSLLQNKGNYPESKKEKEAKRIWRKYLEEYPKGIYSQVIKTYLKGGD